MHIRLPLSSWRSISMGVLAIFGVLGCIDQGGAKFDVADLTTDVDCIHDAFPITPTVMNLVFREDSRGIFMQSQAGSFDRSDLVYLEVYHFARTKISLQTGPGARNGMAVAAEIELGESCPTPQSLRIEGTIYFDSLDTEDGGRISGRTEGADLARFSNGSWDPIGRVDGDWDFEVLHTRTRR
jgi:hypothetical protein